MPSCKSGEWGETLTIVVNGSVEFVLVINLNYDEAAVGVMHRLEHSQKEILLSEE
jgi:hypothetical protein